MISIKRRQLSVNLAVLCCGGKAAFSGLLKCAAAGTGIPGSPADSFIPARCIPPTFIVGQSGEYLSLADIRFPDPFDPGQETTLKISDAVPARNRWLDRRIVAHATTTGAPESAENDFALILVENGKAFVFPDGGPRPAHASKLATLYAAEDRARAKRVGIWVPGNGKQLSFNADEGGHISTGLKIVSGPVVSVKAGAGNTPVFINFASDWRSDFTIGIASEAATAFPDVSKLEGKTVQVRGYVRNWNGPFMELTRPDRLRIMKNGDA